MAKFEASDYSRFRVFYPGALFQGLGAYCGATSRPLRVLDLGSGTGFAAHSFLEFYPELELTLVEPDLAMLGKAKELFKGDARVRFVHSSAEAFEISNSFDLVLIGSAWHWMDRSVLLRKFESAQVGAIWVGEYQFPKAARAGKLNEWVRREFNLRWRTENQIPRGTLIELTQGIRDSNIFFEWKRSSLTQEEEFDLGRFWGMIVSQSRFLAFESGLKEEARSQYREQLRLELTAFWALEKQIPFFLLYEGVFFLRRKI